MSSLHCCGRQRISWQDIKELFSIISMEFLNYLEHSMNILSILLQETLPVTDKT